MGVSGAGIGIGRLLFSWQLGKNMLQSNPYRLACLTPAGPHPNPVPKGKGDMPANALYFSIYFRLMVVFTPCDVALSSNQRAVIVLVCV